MFFGSATVMTHNNSNHVLLHIFVAAGSHLLISLSTSECLYLNRNTQKVRSLSRWRGHLIESVGWNKLLGNETNTGPILVGTSQGIIFEAEISATEGSLFNTNPDQYFRQVRSCVANCHVLYDVSYTVTYVCAKTTVKLFPTFFYFSFLYFIQYVYCHICLMKRLKSYPYFCKIICWQITSWTATSFGHLIFFLLLLLYISVHGYHGLPFHWHCAELFFSVKLQKGYGD